MNKNWFKQWWVEYLFLALIIAFAAALRFYKLGAWSYWVDELYTFENGLRDYSDILHRPFWIITKFAIESFGSNSFALRIFPCIFGIVTIPFLYFPIRKIFNSRVALLAITFLSISPWHIYLSQLARWYSLLLLVSTFSLISFYFFIERNSLKFLITSVLLFAFALTLHLTAVFVLMIAITYLILLSCLPNLWPQKFSRKKTNIFLLVLVSVALMFIPQFVDFVKQWREIQEAMGYWGSTPINFTLKVLYHLTPSVGFVSLVGIILLLVQTERRGLFLAIYCILPVFFLNVAAAFETNVSAKYVFFILPGLLIATSYLCLYVIDHIKLNKKLIGLAIIAGIALPAIQTDFTYFTAGYGNRNRLKEAVSYVKSRNNSGDQIFLLYFFKTPEEGKFYFDTIAKLDDFYIDDKNYIFPNQPDEIDLSRRIWVLTIGKNILPNSTGFYKWIAENTNIAAEFNARRGPDDNSVRVYLREPSLSN